MDLTFYIGIIIFILIIIQTIAGVGILVIGTPVLLFLNYEFIELLYILLPISILTSFANILHFKYIKKRKQLIDNNTKKQFFIITVPSVFIGMMLITLMEDTINFDYLVSSVIIISIILTYNKKLFNFNNLKTKLIILHVTGVIHGLSNSGGTLLSLFISSNKNKNNSVYHIHYFYFSLALLQYIFLIIIFGTNFNVFDYSYVVLIMPVIILIGNSLYEKVNEDKFKQTIKIIAIVSCIFLLSK